MHKKHPKIAIQPCPLDWYAMEQRDDGHRFCSQCNKVVHDMSGLAEEAVIAFLDNHPGACGNFYAEEIDALPRPVQPELKSVRQRIVWKKAVAAAAVLALLGGTVPAKAVHLDVPANNGQSDRLRDSGEPQPNTLLTGVVIDQFEHAVKGKIRMVITQDGNYIEDWLVVENGLFHIDLAGRVDTEKKFTVTIVDQDIKHGKLTGLRKTVRLQDAQNLNLQVSVAYRLRRGGVMIRNID
jgi:hypothetical protein